MNLDNMPPVCGKKKKKNLVTLPYFIGTRWTPESSALTVCSTSLWDFVWCVRMEEAVLGLGKENSLPEFGKGNVMPM